MRRAARLGHHPPRSCRAGGVLRERVHLVADVAAQRHPVERGLAVVTAPSRTAPTLTLPTVTVPTRPAETVTKTETRTATQTETQTATQTATQSRRRPGRRRRRRTATVTQTETATATPSPTETPTPTPEAVPTTASAERHDLVAVVAARARRARRPGVVPAPASPCAGPRSARGTSEFTAAEQEASWVEDSLTPQVLSRTSTAEAQSIWTAAQPRLLETDATFHTLTTTAPDAARAGRATDVREPAARSGRGGGSRPRGARRRRTRPVQGDGEPWSTPLAVGCASTLGPASGSDPSNPGERR